SMYFNPSSQATGFNSGTTGLWLIGNNIAGNDSNSFSIYNPSLGTKVLKLDIGGQAAYSNNLTVSGAFQSFQTSLLSTSASVINGKIGTGIIGTNISTIGTTSGERT